MIHVWIARFAGALVGWFLLLLVYSAVHTFLLTDIDSTWWTIRNGAILAVMFVFPLGWYAIISANRLRRKPNAGLWHALSRAVPQQQLVALVVFGAVLAVGSWALGMSPFFVGGRPEPRGDRYVIASRNYVVRESTREEYLRDQWLTSVVGAGLGAVFSMFGWGVAHATAKATRPL